MTLKRKCKINDYFHKSTRFVTNQLVSGHYNTLIIGYNKCWKQDVNLGASKNQSFTSIPHYKLISMLKYKCKLEGINVVVREESYTSKASVLDKDKIPCIGDKEVSFSGKRIKRGLYCSTKGIIMPMSMVHLI